eukprot:1140228-Pelagomonas_calceolata.AAC.2
MECPLQTVHLCLLKRILGDKHTTPTWLQNAGLTLARLARAMPSAIRLDLACCVHGCWTDALNWRGTAGFLLQGLGELVHAWAS